MDDRGLRSAMVEPHAVASPAEKPYALRATIYTIGFLAFILGLVPGIFHLIGQWSLHKFFNGFDFDYLWPEGRRLVGISLFFGGLLAYVFCSVWLIVGGRGPHVEFDPPKVFVASGPYRWVRNPVVITLMLVVVGEAIYFASIGIVLLVLIGLPLAHYQVTRIEEPRLKARFGESYEQYLQRVPRWLPHRPLD